MCEDNKLENRDVKIGMIDAKREDIIEEIFKYTLCVINNPEVQKLTGPMYMASKMALDKNEDDEVVGALSSFPIGIVKIILLLEELGYNKNTIADLVKAGVVDSACIFKDESKMTGMSKLMLKSMLKDLEEL